MASVGRPFWRCCFPLDQWLAMKIDEGLWAFRRALICHLPIKIATTIKGLPRSSHDQEKEWRKKKQTRQKEGGPATGLACRAKPKPWAQETTTMRHNTGRSFLNTCLGTAGLDVLCRHTKKLICRETERATTDLNIPMKSSRRGASNSAG